MGMNWEGGKKSIFASYHPLMNFLYFGYVLLVPVFFLHPIFLGISLLSSIAYSIYLGRKKALIFFLVFVLPVMLVAAVFNPMFNHHGATMLFYVHYNPITLEAIIYGICNAAMLGSVILWFSCYNAIMTSDKFIYLFGRIVPAMSLIISMALRLVPRYQAQVAKINSARRGIGFDVSSGNYLQRVKSGGEVLSVMVTWALENGIETGDSMLARGYGLPGRTAYSNYRFDTRDHMLLAALLALICMVLTNIFAGTVSVQYYVSFILGDVWQVSWLAYICHAVVCLLPLGLEIREELLWQSLRSSI